MLNSNSLRGNAGTSTFSCKRAKLHDNLKANHNFTNFLMLSRQNKQCLQ